MELFEKVEKGLECCNGAALFLGHCQDKCPYKKDAERANKCIESLLTDALSILKAREPVEPVIKPIAAKNSTNCTQWYACRDCGASIDPDDKYCRRCGRAVKWE